MDRKINKQKSETLLILKLSLYSIFCQSWSFPTSVPSSSSSLCCCRFTYHYAFKPFSCWGLFSFAHTRDGFPASQAFLLASFGLKKINLCNPRHVLARSQQQQQQRNIYFSFTGWSALPFRVLQVPLWVPNSFICCIAAAHALPELLIHQSTALHKGLALVHVDSWITWPVRGLGWQKRSRNSNVWPWKEMSQQQLLTRKSVGCSGIQQQGWHELDLLHQELTGPLGAVVSYCLWITPGAPVSLCRWYASSVASDHMKILVHNSEKRS